MQSIFQHKIWQRPSTKLLESYLPGVVLTGETKFVDDLLIEKNMSASRSLGSNNKDATKIAEYPEINDGSVAEIKNQGHCASCWESFHDWSRCT